MELGEAREHYRRFRDDQIRQLALYEARDLTDAGVSALRSEVLGRGLSKDLLEAIDSQLGEFSPAIFAELIEWLRQWRCPTCDGEAALLNAASVASVKSFIMFTKTHEKVIVACPKCIQRAVQRARTSSMILGWWGIPSGPIETLGSFVRNAEATRWSLSGEASPTLMEYVFANLGRLVVQYKRNQDPFNEPE